ncbi:MAG: DegT/DnrJ/EryC1/StrS aminotransferase family protein [Gammaproteobacteria bacterium]|jgi:dTDP-4-amino-4,6-dideoxygalactose transaminase
MTILPFTRPSIGEAELRAVREVLESGWITSGPKVQQLEQALADYVGGGVQVRVFNSATSGLEAALLAAGIGPGDEVIVPAISFVATANVVLRVGARPVFVEVDLHSRNLDAEAVAAALTPNTRAVIPVHFAGLAVDMEPLYALAAEHGLLLLEDAAQAIGTEYQGRKIGASGNPVCFSFHPNKNMTTIEGGAVASNDAAFIKRLEQLRFHGMDKDSEGNIDVAAWGGKMNLPDVNAAVGLAQLARLDGFNRRRHELVQQYFQRLSASDVLVLPADGEGHSWHMFCVCIDHVALGKTRAGMLSLFSEHGIAVGTHYPAIHLFSLYRRFGYGEGDFPVAERIGAQTLTLPLFPAMTGADVEQVCATVTAIVSGEI